MFKIFNIANYTATPTAEALRIEAFKKLWDRDESEKKEQALKDFSYVAFMCDPTRDNPFFGYNEVGEREERIKQYGAGMKGYSPDDEVIEAVEVYNQMLDTAIPSLNMYRAAMRAKAELERFLNTVDLDERDDKGKQIFDFKKLADTLKVIKDTAASLKTLQENVYKESYEASKIRGAESVSEFEM